MSSWVALRRRVPIEAGQSVLVLGATGNAGAMAVQVAKRLGAGTVIGADHVVALSGGDGALAAAAAEVDIVIDYVWGEPAQKAIVALLTARSDRSRRMDWIQIGAMAGPTIELPSLVDEIAAGTIAVTPRTIPLADVERIWSEPDRPGERTVVVP